MKCVAGLGRVVPQGRFGFVAGGVGLDMVVGLLSCFSQWSRHIVWSSCLSSRRVLEWTGSSSSSFNNSAPWRNYAPGNGGLVGID